MDREMFESVLNSWAWWGLFAVSVPVIIHLINRLRYKRINWAAMEFLLKAMQRQKRKLILEQLILLLLRCLLVLLVVLLIVRPTWFLGNDGSTSMRPRKAKNTCTSSAIFAGAIGKRLAMSCIPSWPIFPNRAKSACSSTMWLGRNGRKIQGKRLPLTAISALPSWSASRG